MIQFKSNRLTHSPLGKLPTPAVVLGLTLAVLFIAFSLFAELYVIGSLPGMPISSFVLLLGCGLLSVFLIFLHERLWIWITIVAMLALVFRPGDGSFGATELIYAIYVSLGLAFWFVKEVMIYRNQIIYSAFDWLLLIAVVLSMCMASIGSLYYEASSRLFSREFLSFFSLLLYYPYRKSMQKDRDIIILVALVTGVSFINGFNNLATYQEQVIQSALEFGEVNARATANELLSTMLICIAFAWMAFTRNLKTVPISMAILVAGIAFLLMTLSRGPIAAAAVGVFIAFFLIPPGRAVTLLLSILTAVSVLIVTLLIAFPSFSQSIINSVSGRLETFEQLGSDESLNSRFYEAEGVLKAVAASPVFGYGYGVKFSFYNKPFKVTGRTGFIHNGYVHLPYKYGIPAGLLLFFALLYPILRIPFSSLRKKSRNKQMFAIGAVIALTSLLVTNFTSNSVAAYISLTLYALSYAILDYVYSEDKHYGRASYIYASGEYV